jgi:hypothetical protein
MRHNLPGRVVIAILVDGVAHRPERELVDGILHEGNIPLILTTRDPVAAAVTDWIRADRAVSLPDGAPVISHVDA